jgi:hypothetical protein
MFERLRELLRRDPERKQQREDRKARRAEHGDPSFERSADAEAEVRHYDSRHKHGGASGGMSGGTGGF